MIAVAGAAVLALLLGARRWREAAFLGGSVAAQSAVFLLVTLCVDRPRPTAPRLDGAPPTSSFPSGHVGAAVALYGALAVLAVLRLRGPLRLPLCALAALLPVLVGFSRLYRGMHHPTDVLAGLVNGGAVLWIMWRAFLSDPRETTVAAVPDHPSMRPGGGGLQPRPGRRGHPRPDRPRPHAATAGRRRPEPPPARPTPAGAPRRPRSPPGPTWWWPAAATAP